MLDCLFSHSKSLIHQGTSPDAISEPGRSLSSLHSTKNNERKSIAKYIQMMIAIRSLLMIVTALIGLMTARLSLGAPATGGGGGGHTGARPERIVPPGVDIAGDTDGRRPTVPKMPRAPRQPIFDAE